MPNFYYPAMKPETYLTVLRAGEPFDFVSAHTIYPYDTKYGVGNGKPCVNTYIHVVFDVNGKNVFIRFLILINIELLCLIPIELNKSNMLFLPSKTNIRSSR